MSDLAPPPGEFWVSSGHLFCDRDAEGCLRATPDLWRAFLARPELVPPAEACAAERALHAALLEAPLRPVAAAEVARLADPDARENWTHFLAFRDRVAAHPTLERAWCALYREGVSGLPPVLLQMLTHLVARAALEGEDDPFTLRAAELFFRPQRAAIHQGALLLADEEVVAARAAAGGLGALGRLLAEAGAPPREVELEVLSEANAARYRARSDAHDFALDIAEGRPGQAGLARALARFIRHVFGETVAIRAVPVIEDRDWTWHVGLDAEATAIANELWHGERVAQERLARILWLGVLEFADPGRVLPRVRGRPVYLALAMDAARRVRMKPQNLVTGLPLVSPS
ncbi:DUF6352 family protein [Caldovatus aquaticus]|uniref:Uncharacterized protein n=1 Tax=Caldovatus aquaticus TaxID=2865671 RepID=A0ABS7F741_9PROT|nr:DUF6352 family protein [Caldovatus aquaticus]MBW8271434.1 hypothetical protein [Caldovatus aquaticus]